MEGIFGCLAGIFVGLTTSWYFQIKPISEKDNLIQQQRYKLRKIKITRNFLKTLKTGKNKLKKKLTK